MDKTITLEEIAKLAGVTLQAIWNWQHRKVSNRPAFPAPTGHVPGHKGRPAYNRAAVMKWLRENGRLQASKAAKPRPTARKLPTRKHK